MKKQPKKKRHSKRRVRRVLEHYEKQTEQEAVAEDEAAFQAQGQTVMIVPTELVPKIRQMLTNRGEVINSESA